MGRQRSEFVEWLQVRRPEIEGLTLARICGIASSSSLRDPEYLTGLRAAVSAALDYGLVGLERGEEQAGDAPTALLAQARQAARSGVALDTVLRRYFAGYALLGDFIIQAAGDGDVALQGVDLHRVWRIASKLFDRLIAAAAAEYTQEAEGRLRNADERRAEDVRMLLAGHLLDPVDFQYEFDAWHIGAVASGPGAAAVIREISGKLDRRLLLVRSGGGTVWAWFGGQSKVPTQDLIRFAVPIWPAGVSMALGESERGVSGWRLTHRQARAAITIALRRTPQIVRYADVALLASALHDDVLADSLQRLYLDPLAYERDGGAVLRQTLSAYFTAGRNVSSAAAALGLSRQTVNSRLRLIEQLIGCPLVTCAAEIETALRVQELGSATRPGRLTTVNRFEQIADAAVERDQQAPRID